MNWYYAQDNQRHGPISENEFDYLVHLKKILPDTLVWNEGMADWQHLREVQPEAVVPPPLPPEAAAQQAASLEALERTGPSWEDRDSIGGLNAAAKTVRELLGNRHRAFSRMKLTADWPGPFCFALFLGGIGFYISLIYNVIFIRLGWIELKGSANMFATNMEVAVVMLGLFFVIPIVIFGIVILNSVIIHGCLMILGDVKQPFQSTYRVVCYSFGASCFFQLIPGFGGVVAFGWNLILLISGIARIHEISTAKATLCMVPIMLYMGLVMMLGLSAM